MIDFIDMKDQKHRLDVERIVKTHVKNDKARTQVGRISKFGLMEMSRQRIRPTIEFGSFEPCKFCRGKGVTPSTETLVLRFIRKLRLETLQNDISSVKGIVPSDVADYILNKKRKEILDLELSRNINIAIEADSSMIPGESNIICEK